MSLPFCFGGEGFSSQVTPCWWVPSLPARGSGVSPGVRVGLWCAMPLQPGGHALSREHLLWEVLSSPPLPSAGAGRVGRQAVDLVESSRFTASGRCLVNALLPACESLGWVPLCFGTGPGGIRGGIRHIIDPELPAAGFPALCKREVGGTTEDALHELLRPVVIEELPSHGVLLSSFLFLRLLSEYAGCLTIDMRLCHCS